MSLPCCFTDDDTPCCDARRHQTSPMCLRHTKEAMRRAILDCSMPADCMSEIIQLTDWFVKAKEMNRTYEMGRDLARMHAEHARQEHRKVAQQSVVYYVRLTGGRVKIGWTSNLEQRLRNLRATAHDLLAIEPGGQPVEAQRHRQFAHLRIGRTEEFRESPGLRDHIESLRQAAA